MDAASIIALAETITAGALVTGAMGAFVGVAVASRLFRMVARAR